MVFICVIFLSVAACGSYYTYNFAHFKAYFFNSSYLKKEIFQPNIQGTFQIKIDILRDHRLHRACSVRLNDSCAIFARIESLIAAIEDEFLPGVEWVRKEQDRSGAYRPPVLGPHNERAN